MLRFRNMRLQKELCVVDFSYVPSDAAPQDDSGARQAPVAASISAGRFAHEPKSLLDGSLRSVGDVPAGQEGPDGTSEVRELRSA